MEPIVSPWVIYLIGNADAFIFGLFLFGWLPALLGLGFCLDKERITVKGFFLFLIAMFLWCACVFFPSSKTITAMVAAQYVTTNNLEQAKDAGRDATTFLLDEIFKRINEPEKDKE
jgi:hypothetical protein